MTVSAHDLEAAYRLDWAMLHKGQEKRDFRLLELANWFGIARWNSENLAVIEEALHAAELAVMPAGIASLTSGGEIVRVCRPVKRVTEPSVKTLLGELLQLSVWTWAKRGEVEMLPRDAVAERDPLTLRDQLTWFHIDLRSRGALIDQRVLLEFLAERCPGISRDVIEDLFSPDALSGSRRRGIDGELRVVSIPEILVERDAGRIAQVAKSSDASGHSKCGVLRRRMTEIAAGPRWVLTVWHDPTWHGKGIDRAHSFTWDEPIGPDPQYKEIVDLVLRRWEVAPARQSGSDRQSGYDLAMMILLVIGKDHADARREMYAWLDKWDSAFYLADAQSRDGDEFTQFERATLLDLRQLVTLFRTDVVALDSPESGIANAWFHGNLTDAQEFSAMMDRTIGDLRDLSDGIRTSFDLLATAGMEKALTYAKIQNDYAQERERQAKVQEGQAATLNRRIQAVGLLLLGPSLLATLLAVSQTNLNVHGYRNATFVFAAGVFLTLMVVLLRGTANIAVIVRNG